MSEELQQKLRDQLWEEYKNAIVEKHKDRATSYFKKQIKKLKTIPHYDWIQFHLILFPVPKKDDIVSGCLNM